MGRSEKKAKVMRNTLIMERKPVEIKKAGVEFTVKRDTLVQGTLKVTGTKISWYPKNKFVNGFYLTWEDFASLMQKSGHKTK